MYRTLSEVRIVYYYNLTEIKRGVNELRVDKKCPEQQWYKNLLEKKNEAYFHRSGKVP